MVRAFTPAGEGASSIAAMHDRQRPPPQEASSEADPCVPRGMHPPRPPDAAERTRRLIRGGRRAAHPVKPGARRPAFPATGGQRRTRARARDRGGDALADPTRPLRSGRATRERRRARGGAVSTGASVTASVARSASRPAEHRPGGRAADDRQGLTMSVRGGRSVPASGGCAEPASRTPLGLKRHGCSCPSPPLPPLSPRGSGSRRSSRRGARCDPGCSDPPEPAWRSRRSTRQLEREWWGALWCTSPVRLPQPRRLFPGALFNGALW